MKIDKELQEFQDLMKVPDKFEEGFGWRTVAMALFVGLVMAPAQIYMFLVAGVELGSAAQWVTVILYVEVARRAFTKLRRPEIFVLFYMCGAVVHSGGGLLWHQFLVQSEEMRKLGITEFIPEWFAPKDPNVLATRNFLMPEWWMPIGLMIMTMFLTRVDNFGLGYIMFRLTSDVEKLPFPMAPVGAMGMTALADASGQRDTWRWRVFSVGATAGTAFGAIYLALPSITGALFGTPFQILPLPFADMTPYTERVLPAMPFLISFDLGMVVTGLVLPFWAMMGAGIGLIFTIIVNPLLYEAGALDGWERGVGGIQTIQSNVMDFYFSFGLGLSLAVALIGMLHLVSSLRRREKDLDEAGRPGVEWSKLFKPPAGRGDFPLWLALLFYVLSTSTYIGLAYWLVNYASGPLAGPPFPLWLLIFYGFVYTPFISYVSTRMEGIVGQQVAIPFVREASFILSGYKGAAIWFAPIPLHDYARQSVFFKTTELTGTKLTSIIKAEALIFPVTIAGMIIFSQFIWSIDNVPSAMFPYANEFWELNAYNAGLVFSSTLPGEAGSPFQEAFDWRVMGAGLGIALVVYAVLSQFGLPIFLVYGVIRGLDQSSPHSIIPMVIGAFLGRFVLARIYKERWPEYRIVFAAGFTAGVGLITMLSLGVVFASRSVIRSPM